MGATLEITTGYGFAVPPTVVTAYNEAHEDDEDFDGFGEYLWEMVQDEPLLQDDSARWYDYSPEENHDPAYAVFVRSTVMTHYGVGVYHNQNDTAVPTFDECETLRELARKLGVDDPTASTGSRWCIVPDARPRSEFRLQNDDWFRCKMASRTPQNGE